MRGFLIWEFRPVTWGYLQFCPNLRLPLLGYFSPTRQKGKSTFQTLASHAFELGKQRIPAANKFQGLWDG